MSYVLVLSFLFLIVIFVIQSKYLSEKNKLIVSLQTQKDDISQQFSHISLDHNRLNAILGNMVEGIVSVDRSKKILFYNAKILSIFSLNVENYKDRQTNHLAGFEQIDELIELAFSSGKIIEKEYKLLVNEQKKVLHCHALCFDDKDGQSVIVVVQDVTELYKLEKMRKDLVSNVSHELKTPLTAIRGYTETLLEGALEDSDNRTRFVEKIKSNADRLLELVQDILQLAKLESGERNIIISPEDWGPIVEDTISQHEGSIATQNMQVNFVYDVPFKVLGEKESMIQIFVNLFTNAIRYTPDGGEVKIVLTKNASHGILVVEDNGVGIPTKKISRVFERFYLVDKARSGEMGGSGLGLSIVKQFVQGLNGEITVESEVGVGSRFSVRLPLA